MLSVEIILIVIKRNPLLLTIIHNYLLQTLAIHIPIIKRGIHLLLVIGFVVTVHKEVPIRGHAHNLCRNFRLTSP